MILESEYWEFVAGLPTNLDAADKISAIIAWLRINVDGEDWGQVTSFVRVQHQVDWADNVVALRAKGLSIRKIAALCGVSKSSVARLLRTA